MTRFSIVTICYNSEKTIERTIKSVLGQTYTDYEYIIVDGASTDATLSVIEKYIPQFEGRLKVISEPDKGIYDAMNKGIKASVGAMIGIVNSDDWLEPDALQIVNDAIIANGCNYNTNYCGGINYHWDGKVKPLGVNIHSFKKQTKLYIMAGVRHPGIFVPQKVYERIGLFDDEMKLSADLDFILRCYFGGVDFVDVGKVLSNMSEGGISTNNSAKSRQYAMNDRKRMLKKFGKKGIEYGWLLYSWKLRGMVRTLLISLGLYKVS